MDFPVSTEQRDATSEGLEPNDGTRPSRAFLCLPSGIPIRLVLGLLLVSGAAVDVAAQRDDDGFRDLPRHPELRERTGVLEIASSIELEKMLVEEVVAGGAHQARSLGTWTSGTARLGMPRVETEIVRSVGSVWRMRLPDQPSLHTLDARYEVVGNDGRHHVLTAENDADSTIGVRVQPIPPAVVQTDLESTIVEGGLILYLDLAGVRTAGRYSGTITVTLDHF